MATPEPWWKTLGWILWLLFVVLVGWGAGRKEGDHTSGRPRQEDFLGHEKIFNHSLAGVPGPIGLLWRIIGRRHDRGDDLPCFSYHPGDCH